MQISEDEYVASTLARPESGWLYAIIAIDVNQVKIGWTKDVDKRVRTLQTGSPIELIVHSATLEAHALAAEIMAHSKLSHARLMGEWFDLEDAAVDKWLAARETESPENGRFDRYQERRARRT